MELQRRPFGQLPDGSEATIFTLANNKGMEVDITDFGGIITSIRIPDKNKNPGDVVLGFDNLEDYMGEHPYFGAIVGRYANRIKNGSFKLEGVEYKLAVNNGPNHLHGGLIGFDKVLWAAATVKDLDSVSLRLGYESKDMEEGYPGNLLVETEYSLNDSNELIISFRAKSDKSTHINLTNHSYFNLDNCQGDIYNHQLMIDADQVLDLDEYSAPTGNIINVEETAWDFRISKKIGNDISETGMGYDVNYCINSYDGALRRIATLYHNKTGRYMDVLTTQPGVQLYTANYVNGIVGKGGIVYKKHSAVCLETQHYPDSPNQPGFPSTILKAGEEFHEATVYRFGW